MNIEIIRERLMFLRKKNIISLNRMAADIEMAPNLLSEFLKGKEVSFMTLAKIEKYLDSFGEKND